MSNIKIKISLNLGQEILKKAQQIKLDVQDIKELAMCTSELGYTQGVKKASENLNRTLKSCSMAYSRYFPTASKNDVVNAKPITNSYTARTGRVEHTTAKKLVVNLSSSMTCTIQDNGLITVDFKP